MNTGHERQSPRHEVGDEVIDLLRPIIQRGAGEISDTRWGIRMVEGAAPGSCGFTLHYDGSWIVSCYMAWSKEGANAMWPIAKHTAGLHVVGQPYTRPAAPPWIAVVMMPKAFSSGIEALMEAGDLERCVAWTVLETMTKRENAA